MIIKRSDTSIYLWSWPKFGMPSGESRKCQPMNKSGLKIKLVKSVHLWIEESSTQGAAMWKTIVMIAKCCRWIWWVLLNWIAWNSYDPLFIEKKSRICTLRKNTSKNPPSADTSINILTRYGCSWLSSWWFIISIFLPNDAQCPCTSL